MSLPLRFLLAVLVVGPMAGCASSDAVADEEMRWSESVLRDHLRQLAEPGAPSDSVVTARRTLYAVRQMRAARLMPAREPSFLLRMGGTDMSASPEAFVGPTQAHVLGYVAGRHPSYYDELVLVAADLDTPGAAAALEAARALVEEARYTQTPERSVLFALWAPPRTGARGLRDFLANPTWVLSHITRVLLVTTDSTALAESRQLLEARGIPSEAVEVEDRSVTVQGARPEVEQARRLVRTLRLTEALYTQVVTAATTRDSTVALP